MGAFTRVAPLISPHARWKASFWRHHTLGDAGCFDVNRHQVTLTIPTSPDTRVTPAIPTSSNAWWQWLIRRPKSLMIHAIPTSEIWCSVDVFLASTVVGESQRVWCERAQFDCLKTFLKYVKGRRMEASRLDARPTTATKAVHQFQKKTWAFPWNIWLSYAFDLEKEFYVHLTSSPESKWHFCPSEFRKCPNMRLITKMTQIATGKAELTALCSEVIQTYNRCTF